MIKTKLCKRRKVQKDSSKKQYFVLILVHVLIFHCKLRVFISLVVTVKLVLLFFFIFDDNQHYNNLIMYHLPCYKSTQFVSIR